MDTYNLDQMGQVIGLGLFIIVFLDFLRSSVRKGEIHFADFPIHLFVLLGRALDAFVALIFGLASQSRGQLIPLKTSGIQSMKFRTPINHFNQRWNLNKNEETKWLNWGRQKCPVLIHTLERAGAHIYIEKNQLPGYQNMAVGKNHSNTPVPKMQTLDFQVRYSDRVGRREVHFIPDYFYGVDPSLRSAIRQRIEDGTLAVALSVPARNVSFMERDGLEAVVVMVGESTVPPLPKAGKGPMVQQPVPELGLELDLSPVDANLPPLTIFNRPKAKKQESRDTAEVVLQAFSRLGVGTDSHGATKFRHVKTVVGPTVSQVIFQSSGLKISSLSKEGENIAAELGIQGSVRISAVPGMPGCFGVEVPNEQRGTVTLLEMAASSEFRHSKSALPLCIGVTINGKPLIADLAKLPHLLVAGATNQGKSVGLNAMILSLVLRCRPSELKLIMVDPKAVELTVYEDLPHLLAPIATEPKEAIQLLNGMVAEMETRYAKFRAKKARNIGEYNAKVLSEKQLPYVVGIIDEYADLIMGAKSIGKDLETAVARLGQKARAAGLHLILATQRPTADIVTGLIKANMPGRLAYKVSSTIDSQVILDRPGAESLTGMGDLLLLGPTDPEPVRAQGPLVTDEEIERLVKFWSQETAVDETFKLPTVNEKTGPEIQEDELPSPAVEFASEPVAKVAQDFKQNRSGLGGAARKGGISIPRVPATFIVEGRGSHKVNLGLPPRPAELNMSEKAWCLLYGYSVRLVVRDKRPKREYIQIMLSIKTAAAQMVIQLMEKRSIISPYKGPHAPRKIYVTLEQVDQIYPEDRFSMDNYAEISRQ